MSLWTTVGSGCVLALAVALISTGGHQIQPKLPIAGQGLAKWLPSSSLGWTTPEHRIAESDEMRRAVSDLLHYDGAVFRTFSRPGMQFDVYAAYWRPGVIASKEVAAHAPDVCWALNGWKLMAGDFSRRLGVADPAQYRVFVSSVGRRHVLFWHWADGQIVTYQTGIGPAWWAAIAEVCHRGVRLKPEQLFVRISSETPIDELQREPMFRIVLERLATIRERSQKPG